MAETDPRRSSRPVVRLARRFEARIANPLFSRLLRSRLHWVTSSWLLVLSYTGRQSGETFTTPIAYAAVDDALVAVTPETTTWWRNFREPYACTVWLRGAERSAVGEVITGDDRATLLAEYADERGLLARMLGIEAHPGDARPNPDLVVVRFAPA